MPQTEPQPIAYHALPLGVSIDAPKDDTPRAFPGVD